MRLIESREPVDRTYVIELTEEELVRIHALSQQGEGSIHNDGFRPSDLDRKRICYLVEDMLPPNEACRVYEAAADRFDYVEKVWRRRG